MQHPMLKSRTTERKMQVRMPSVVLRQTSNFAKCQVVVFRRHAFGIDVVDFLSCFSAVLGNNTTTDSSASNATAEKKSGNKIFTFVNFSLCFCYESLSAAFIS